MPSTPSSPRLVPVSTSQDASSSISSPLLSMRSALAPTANSSTPSNSSLVRRTPPTTSPVVTTPSVRRLLISASTESVSSPISALVSRASSASPSTHPHRSPPPSLSHTTQSSPPTPSWSTLMLPLCSTTRPSTISAAATSISRDQPTPT